MKVTLQQVFDTARSMLQGGDTSASIGFSNTQMQQFFNVAYPEMLQVMAQTQTGRIRRSFFHYLPAYTNYFDPYAIGITDFGEPEWMEERGGVTTVTITGTTDTTPIRVSTSGGHGVSSVAPIQIADVAGTTAPWGMWYGTYLSPTLLSLNGSTAPGVAGTGGRLMYSTQKWQLMQAVRDMPYNAQPGARLGVWQWQDNALHFVGATQPTQIHVTYWASAVPPTALSTELGIDDCLSFLSTRVASLAARARGWYQMASELKLDALGPSGQADGTGGLLRTWLNIQTINMQAMEFRKPAYGAGYTDPWIYGTFPGGTGGGSALPTTNPCGGYYVVPVSGGSAPLDLSLGVIQEVTLTSNTAISVPANLQPGPFWLRLIQDVTGGWDVTFPADYVGIDPTAFSGTGVAGGTTVNLSLAVQDDLNISLLGVTYGPV